MTIESVYGRNNNTAINDIKLQSSPKYYLFKSSAYIARLFKIYLCFFVEKKRPIIEISLTSFGKQWKFVGAPNKNIVRNHLNIALLKVF